MASNHLVTLVNDCPGRAALAPASRIRCGCSAPLLTASLDNALRLGDDALTGPISRGDAATVEAHIHALHGTKYLQPYLAMALRTMQRAYASGRLTPAAVRRADRGHRAGRGRWRVSRDRGSSVMRLVRSRAELAAGPRGR